MRKFSKEFMASTLTLVLAIFSVLIFIKSGPNILFYIIVSIALIVGFYNAWILSKKESFEDFLGTEKKKTKKRSR